MGAAFSCFQVGDADQQTRCLCLDFAVDPILRAWTTLFPGSHPSDPRDVTPELVMDDSSCDTYRPPPRPPSFDDPRCSYMVANGLISPRNKALAQLHETAEMNRNNDESGAESLCGGEKLKDPDSPLKQAPKELEYGLLFAFTFPEEDSCPICLEEYFPENPKITLQCMHHFHLACIYEWMERSEACPICGKVMELDEKT